PARRGGGGGPRRAPPPRGGPPPPAAAARHSAPRRGGGRPRPRSELRNALLRKEIDEDVADAVLQKFVDAGLVDDAEFAEAWVNERQRNQGLGRKALGYELRRKGVEEHLVAEALSAVDPDAEEERARELVRRKLRSARVDDQEKLLRRLVGMLARKGYSEGLAFRVAKDELGRADDPDLS
ncbi:regulatory protein RecX, partial [Saccharopolyspora sp. 6V]|uniref:regulatory protein RecX n=1 Tax=Saccharopolyspora sp. 6V TaxID=2877239 RepID=UPI0035A83A9F